MGDTSSSGTITSSPGRQLLLLSGTATAANSSATQIILKGGNGNGTGNGATIQSTGGNGGTSGSGGSLVWLGGNAGASGNGAGGNFFEQAGAAAGAGNGGSLNYTAGPADLTGQGGGFLWTAGAGGSTSGDAGNFVFAGNSATGAANFGSSFTLTPGTGADADHGGQTAIQDPNGDNSFVVDRYGNIICACANSPSATDQFLYLGVSAGAPTGIPAHTTGVYANSVPVRYDTTDDRLYVYNSGWKNVANSAQAEQTISFQPGPATSVINTKGAFTRFVKTSTVDNITVSALQFTCTVNPTVTLYECATSGTCAAPTTIGAATVTAAGTGVSGAISAATINAGDFIAWAISAGTCTSLNVSATAQVHSN